MWYIWHIKITGARIDETIMRLAVTAIIILNTFYIYDILNLKL